MHVGRRRMCIGDDGVAAIHGAMIEREEPVRLAIPHRVAGALVGSAHLDFLRLGLSLRLLFQGRLATRRPILGDGAIKPRQVLLWLQVNLGQVVLVLIRVGLRWVESVCNTVPEARPLFNASSTIWSKISSLIVLSAKRRQRFWLSVEASGTLSPA